MKAITLTQPYATLIAIGAKRIETRGWSTTYRGPIAIHAGQGLGPVGGRRGFRELIEREPFASALRDVLLADGSLPRGAIVAVARLVDSCSLAMQGSRGCYYNETIGGWVRVSEQETAFGDYNAGRYGFLLDRVEPLETPAPARGALGLWEYNPKD